MKLRHFLPTILVFTTLSACITVNIRNDVPTADPANPTATGDPDATITPFGATAEPDPASDIDGETAEVITVIDGDTIDVRIDGVEYRVRYVGINTPEFDEPCYDQATAANESLVANQTVTLVRDVSNTDRFDRLLRYIYVGDVFVNEELIRSGWAEVVLYEPDDANFDLFRSLEQTASAANIGCHASGIFDDDTFNR